jgi:hypothetical protein
MTTPLPQGWEADILADIDAPDTANDVSVLDAWQQAEGGSTNNPDAYNPFNTTRNTDSAGDPLGGTPTNSVGVLSFPSWQAGEDATAATLEQSNMGPILSDLQSSAAPATTEAAITSSPWGTKSIAGVSSSGSAGSSTSATLTGLNLDPGDLFGIPSTVEDSVWSSVEPFIVEAILVIAGLGIIMLGLFTATKGARDDVKSDAQQAAPLALAAG